LVAPQPVGSTGEERRRKDGANYSGGSWDIIKKYGLSGKPA
jgi:hypothetical protein